MLLSVKNRLWLLLLLPKESNLSTQAIARDISKKVEVDEETKKNIDYVQLPNGDLKWDPSKEQPFSVDFSAAEILVLKEVVNDLDANKKITQDNLDLCIEIRSL